MIGSHSENSLSLLLIECGANGAAACGGVYVAQKTAQAYQESPERMADDP
jgi:hypothetical protein